MLTKRERVLRTVNFQETDYTPIYDIFQNDGLIEHYAGEPITPENGYRVKGIVIGKTLDMTRMPDGPAVPREERDANGFLVRHERWTSWIIESRTSWTCCPLSLLRFSRDVCLILFRGIQPPLCWS